MWRFVNHFAAVELTDIKLIQKPKETLQQTNQPFEKKAKHLETRLQILREAAAYERLKARRWGGLPFTRLSGGSPPAAVGPARAAGPPQRLFLLPPSSRHRRCLEAALPPDYNSRHAPRGPAAGPGPLQWQHPPGAVVLSGSPHG